MIRHVSAWFTCVPDQGVKIERLIVVKRQGNIRNTAILMMYKCTKMNRVVKKRESWIDVMIATRKRRYN